MLQRNMRMQLQKYGANNIKRAYTYKALNRLIQGSSADQN